LSLAKIAIVVDVAKQDMVINMFTFWAIFWFTLFAAALYCEIRNIGEKRTIFELIFDRFVLLPVALVLGILHCCQEPQLIFLTVTTFLSLKFFSNIWNTVYEAIMVKFISKFNIGMIVLYTIGFAIVMCLPLLGRFE
jgi:hypothetical protein